MPVRKSMQIKKTTHDLLVEISAKRKVDGNPKWTIADIISEMTIKQHKKEVK